VGPEGRLRHLRHLRSEARAVQCSAVDGTETHRAAVCLARQARRSGVLWTQRFTMHPEGHSVCTWLVLCVFERYVDYLLFSILCAVCCSVLIAHVGWLCVRRPPSHDTADARQ